MDDGTKKAHPLQAPAAVLLLGAGVTITLAWIASLIWLVGRLPGWLFG
jgi:hypothetical protein